MGGAYDIVSRYLPFVRKTPKISRDEALRARPVRNSVLEWEKTDDGDIKLRIPARRDRVGRILSRVFRAPGYREILLDEVGSHVWELCDGDHSVESIVTATSKKYQMSRRECEVSVTTYLKMLGDRRLVGLQVGGRRKK